MSNQIKAVVGVAVFAALALSGVLGISVFGAVPPVHAQATPEVTRSINSMSVAQGGNVDVTVTAANVGLKARITETLPVGWSYVSVTPDDVDVTQNGQDITFDIVPIFGTVTYKATAPMTDSCGTFSGTFAASDDDNTTGSVTGDMDVTVGTGTCGGTETQEPDSQMVDVSNASVTARPTDPGTATQVTVRFDTNEDLAIEDSITIEVDDNTGVPGSIAADRVSISGGGNNASPRSVVVEKNNPDERYKITLYVADMSDEDGSQHLPKGTVTVTFRQEAGIKNRTEGGRDEWFVYTSNEPELAKVDNVYTVPMMVKLSSYADSRGENITVRGLGFKGGTTVRFWRDADGMGDVDGNEVVLCTATANDSDVAECSFTLSNPPFKSGYGMDGNMNYINAIDGRGQKVTSPLPKIKLEPSMSLSPSQGSPGDSVNVQLYDFTKGDMVSKVDFGRSFRICDSTDSPNTVDDCSFGVVGDEGGLRFNFNIPNGITPGIQQMRVFAGQGNMVDEMTVREVGENFTVGLGGLQVASTDVLPNQRIHVTGSGFTTSSGQSAVYIFADATRGQCPASSDGYVALGGVNLEPERVNNGDPIKVTSGGTWSASIDLPVDSRTTSASTRELKVVDCLGGAAALDLTFPNPEVTMSPELGRVGSEVVITGKNFPVDNGDSDSDVEITVTYKSGVEVEDEDVDPDGLGSFTVVLEVPEDAAIPSNNTVEIQYTDDNGVVVTQTRTHRVSQGTISFSTSSGGEGSLLTITADGFARYTSVDKVLFDGRDITPSPRPGTSKTGDAEFNVRIPGADPGIYIIEVTVDKVTASQTFTVVSGSGVTDGSVESILANLVNDDALDRVFMFDNMTKKWEWYINNPAFAETNNMAGLSSGDLVWLKVSKSVTADILGTSTTLTCINEGAENEDCWNQISIP